MDKYMLKIFNQNIKDPAEKTQVVVNVPKVESEAQIKLVNVINNWISERRENNRIEKDYSDSIISEWKIMPGNFEDPVS